MGIQLPPELSAVAAQAGVAWPEADEDRLREQAAAWRDAGTKLTNLTRDADNTARTTLSAVSGDTGDAARRHWSTFVEPDTGHLTATARNCTAAADRLDHAATQVGAAKVEIVRNLVALAKNSDAAHQAAGAGHPHAMLGLDTAVRATNANVTHITNTLATAVVPTNGVDVNAVQPLVNPNPGHHAPLQTVTNLVTQTVSDVATLPGDASQRGTDLAARTVSDAGQAVTGLPGDAGQRAGDLAAAGPGAAQGLLGPGHPDITGPVRIPPVDTGPGHHVPDLPADAPTPPTGIQSVHAALAGGGILDPAAPAQALPSSAAGGATPGASGGPAQGFGGAPGFAGAPGPGGGSPTAIPGGGSAPAPPRPGLAPIGGISTPGPVGSAPGPIAANPARPGLGGIGTPEPGAPGSGGSGSPARPGAGGVGGPGGAGNPAAPGGPVAAGPSGSGRPGLGVGVPEPGAPGSGGPGSGARPGVGGAPGGGGPVPGGPVAAGPGGSGRPGLGGAGVPGGVAAGPGGLADAGGPGPGADAARGRGAWSNAVPPGQAGMPAVVPRERRDDGPLLFWMHMFPIGHMPVVSDRPARQLPTPPVEVDFAPGLRFPPGDHPEHGQVRAAPGELVAVGASDGLPAEHETVAGLAAGHDPLGGQHEREWDRRYLVRLGSVTAQGISSAGKEYAWPPGESHPEGGSAEGEPEILEAGTVIDRFGSPRGRVFSADGTPFARRSLPPDHLAVGYRRYRVLRGLPVWRTVSAPWFGQPGGGERYRATYSAIELVALGYLEDVW